MVNKRSEKNLIFKRKEFEQIGIFPWSWLLFRFASNLSGVQKMESRFDQVEKLHIIQHWVGKLIKDMNTTIPTLLMKGTCHAMLVECLWNVQCFKFSQPLFWFQTESIFNNVASYLNHEVKNAADVLNGNSLINMLFISFWNDYNWNTVFVWRRHFDSAIFKVAVHFFVTHTVYDKNLFFSCDVRCYCWDFVRQEASDMPKWKFSQFTISTIQFLFATNINDIEKQKK